MTLLFDLKKQAVAPTNNEFVTFIPEQDVQAAMNNELTNFPRYFSVQTSKKFMKLSVTTSFFEMLKNFIKSQNNEVIKRVEAELPELMGNLSERLKDKYDADLALSVYKIIPMPVHKETDHIISFSSLIRYDVNDENGNRVSSVGVVTTTSVLVKSKMLVLYSYAEESDLEWSKEASIKWAQKVVSANHSDLKVTK
jgi:hypothetical protein